MSQETEQTLVSVEPQGEAKACVIWLHGLGADGFDFQPIVPYLRLPENLNVRFLFPHAEVMPVTVNGGMEMRAWYDILEMNIDRKVDKASLLKSSQRIANLVNEQIAQGIPADKILLVGFSQGGAVAYQTALTFAEPLAGLVALSTYMATEEEIEASRTDANNELAIWVAHGTVDQVVPVQLGEQAYANLENMNYQPSWNAYPIGHEVAIEEIEALGRWMSQRLAV
ncbi:alpha/beta hydrolase [Neptuniibacter sp. SY11_33]|uniref:alpha/beta hydrolase n=1 Tax=Neptuniibacter sp. SY11_33 TaxID=3398215 RepID=UPI0039F549A7